MDLIKPRGCKDYLPNETKTLREIEATLSSLFELWGYMEVIPPSFEYYEFLTEGLGKDYKKKVYKIIDRDGEILALRPELTKPVGRIAMTHLAGEPRPLKLYYRGMIFLREDPIEFPQIGVEIFGDPSICADIEVLSLAIESMKVIGIENPIVDLNHIKLIQGILDSVPVSEDYKELIKETLASKNFVLYREIITFMEIPEGQKNFLFKLPLIRCKKRTLKDVKIPFNSSLIEEALNEIWKILDNIEFEDITIDLGMIRALNYYNGIIFELSNPKEGKIFGGGGRYDKLFNIPATGFAFSFKNLPSYRKEMDIDLIIKVTDTDRDLKKALKLVKKAREKGFKTLLLPPQANEDRFVKIKNPKLLLKMEGQEIDEEELINSLTNGKTIKRNS
ncbi:MAG: ATP phosphoribosyltransferase regulatory subunit [Synergistetes bacterium]|nr:ATP phosphoribosyltransferase regulatory subunit [Synergistota bacterium]MCX8128043.1 ATP phosphoribosyltransferase regulatory subunit [Synergistota bacterium]MDW8193081.1 ATP phosphoribosyltransferase regulatory subunit [Synergistota bacterium]